MSGFGGRQPRPQCLLVREVGGDRGPGTMEIVGEKAQAGVPERSLNHTGLTCDLRLATERPQLPTQLGGQIGEAGEVRRHRLELAECLLLAFTVFEDAGGLLDEGAAILRARVQDRVELTLADNHVQLSADTRVAHQFLDIQQATTGTVDRVFALAAAEHQPPDGHLGVLDGERAVRVVDRQEYFGAPQGRASGRAREDDIGHGAATQGLGTLLPQYPGDGVDDVTLARPVGPDHAGYSRLEMQGGRARKGLEAPQGQVLEMHQSPERWKGSPARPGMAGLSRRSTEPS